METILKVPIPEREENPLASDVAALMMEIYYFMKFHIVHSMYPYLFRLSSKYTPSCLQTPRKSYTHIIPKLHINIAYLLDGPFPLSRKPPHSSPHPKPSSRYPIASSIPAPHTPSPPYPQASPSRTPSPNSSPVSPLDLYLPRPA